MGLQPLEIFQNAFPVLAVFNFKVSSPAQRSFRDAFQDAVVLFSAQDYFFRAERASDERAVGGDALVPFVPVPHAKYGNVHFSTRKQFYKLRATKLILALVGP